ncbi:hypothetical protein LTR56_019126 [Elasticomyces elasticus]|nr:hypothetical protein LTR56_019126 [Elasticomyces elasticus]KAK3635192.1 hypothetical protein LTR22_019333 [Elasticomyces elasticus]KAK4911499.1 putative secondary metabolism biosynthetic enzyme [Elasticomyces elasticus]KAK5751078.1 putative secondary metabolism biosynthetic enzyme [Elasticomyces elasticus]
MSAPTNQAAWLKKANTPLEVSDAPMPTPGPGEIVVKNAAVAINPLDWHMQDTGIFVQQWPTILGCDVAGEVFEVGTGVDLFKKGDHGVVVPFALETALCALCVREPGPCMPGVLTAALGLAYPTLENPAPPAGKVLVVYGASSSVGSMTTQIATAAGIAVVAIAGKRNHDMVNSCGAIQVFDHKNSAIVHKVVEAVRASGLEFVGTFDSICAPETYARDLEILEQLGGGHLACVHPPPVEGVPANVKTGMVFAVNDIAAPVFKQLRDGCTAWWTAQMLSGTCGRRKGLGIRQ